MQQTAEKLPEYLADGFEDQAERPIVVVGNGPVGMRAVMEIWDRLPDWPVVIYGDEQYEPYNRVRLSSWLAGELNWNELMQPLRRPFGAKLEERFGYRVVSIDRDNKFVIDQSGRLQYYHKLILATGSSPFVPNIPGIELNGVFTFRNLDDTNRLLARRASSHHTVVLGGGLLGLEAARGMQPGNTKVTVIEHADRLMNRQLDEAASEQLQNDVEALGIDIVIGDGVKEIFGRERVQGLNLRSGRTLRCDTLIVAAGIRPNIELAQQAKLAFGRGIKVDDAMRSSDPDIYAIGECAEHRQQVYGLVAPGLEQAAVAAADMAGLESNYAGSITASRLKVVGTPVFSMGPVGAGEDQTYAKAYAYRDDEQGVYRKILIRRHRLVGAVGIGDWDETMRLQTAIGNNELIWPWQLLRFHRTGQLWPEEENQGVSSWPEQSVVCLCTGVTRGAMSEAITFGAQSVADVSKATGASTVCGSCKPQIQQLLGSKVKPEPVAMHRTLLGFAGLTLLATLLFLLGPVLPYADSVQNSWHWDVLWRDGLFKQISGFSILGLVVLGLLVSLRKRTRMMDRLGKFDGWRLAHIVLGVLVITTLVAHTGFRFGYGLNFLLMASFSVLLLLGALATAVIALEHRLSTTLVRRLRRQSVLWHILIFWPVPALLGWHIFKSYWY